MNRILLAILLTSCAWSAFAAQESTTTQCIDDAAGNQVCVDTRLYLKEGDVQPPEPEPEPPKFENPAKDAGTFKPLERASERAIAIFCLRGRFSPFIARILRPIAALAFLLYFAMVASEGAGRPIGVLVVGGDPMRICPPGP